MQREHLPKNMIEIQTQGRQAADPLGLRGLPGDRSGLDGMVELLCQRLTAAWEQGLPSELLVTELNLRGCRSLRLLVAYARVYHHVHQIVGVPGDRYFWGDAVEGLYDTIVNQCMRMGRCYLFIAALHKRQGLAMASAQMVFDWFRQAAPGDKADELQALLAVEGVQVGDVLSAMMTEMSKTDQGRAALAKVGQKHRDVLVPAQAVEDLLGRVDQLKNDLAGMLRRAG